MVQSRRSGLRGSLFSSRSSITSSGSSKTTNSSQRNRRQQHSIAAEERELTQNLLTIPALPPIASSSSRRSRSLPLTISEYLELYREKASDFDIIERVFCGGIACDRLRAAIWPYLFGLVKHRGSFERVTTNGCHNNQENTNGSTITTTTNLDQASGTKSKSGHNNYEHHQDDLDSAYVYIEHQDNILRWAELSKQYYSFQRQWKSIMPDQEARFSSFRERKSQIQRDVVRCDRLHPFYRGQSPNLETLTDLLMTYMMYDFDIGYVQGMSDLAGPILYLFRGDLIKSFWVFVEVMKLFRRNFEHTQKTLLFQLDCLQELIRVTDPILSEYLEEHESSNCYFAFRSIVCIFKRELMRDNGEDYSHVLHLWDTIWCVNLSSEQRQQQFLLQQRILNGGSSSNNNNNQHEDIDLPPSIASSSSGDADNNSSLSQISESTAQCSSFYSYNFAQSDTPRTSLTETETFILALCLSMIRGERDLILGNRLDCTGIHLHFIDPKLADDFDGFVERAINIFSFLKYDFDLARLTRPKEYSSRRGSAASPVDNGLCEGDELFNDYLIINQAPAT